MCCTYVVCVVYVLYCVVYVLFSCCICNIYVLYLCCMCCMFCICVVFVLCMCCVCVVFMLYIRGGEKNQYSINPDYNIDNYELIITFPKIN